jgi:hypothetical protein
MTGSSPYCWYLPLDFPNRTAVDNVKLTTIGKFGRLRTARPTVPSHYHTGADIRRPDSNYAFTPVHPAHEGTIISVLDKGPFSQIIIEHSTDGDTVWTAYEHIHVLKFRAGTPVSPFDTIARLFDKTELSKYGWQFDHLHFEVIKKRPPRLAASKTAPDHRYTTFAITCYTEQSLHERLCDPLEFMKEKFGRK